MTGTSPPNWPVAGRTYTAKQVVEMLARDHEERQSTKRQLQGANDEIDRLNDQLKELENEREYQAPAPPEASPRRAKRLSTPKAVVKAIQKAVEDLSCGKMGEAKAKAMIYALQTLLIALRMTENDEKERLKAPIPTLPATFDSE